ncbi:alkaline shock response membrane anchor protein AmaP [Streptomyces sp. P38-E01]|uniref:Alkaline shock response membrane anchor protein AmaP n=1 Tax=Streptomyces tardus TaxID=2780544 RepID=A0A949N9L8_9ACTN|nr:alkaline shock response membrane anchor protein AmaP [Streptomyces tardus]MBU7599721.1 alkaline shock response membrane anchor protein AmaP [Streptomyces tardus]
MLRTLNRLLLALLGLVLLLLGLSALVGALDLPNRWGFGMPSGWAWSRPQEVVLTGADRTQWRDQGWWWPVVIGILALLTLLALWWALSQLRRRRAGELAVSGDESTDRGPGAVLRGRALEQVMGSEAAALDGVSRARVTLVGKRTDPSVRMRVVLDEHAVPDEVVHRLETEVLEHARTSADVGELPAEIRLSSVRHRPSRVN